MPAGDELRALMRRFPAGVAVVTVGGDQPIGLTVGSLVSLSLEPPLVGFSIARVAALHELLREAGSFAVSLLAAAQEDLAARFARGVPPIVMWQGIAAHDDPPRLDGALGWLECRVAGEHRAGDHTFFVGEVTEVEPGPATDPLVYLDGRYVAL